MKDSNKCNELKSFNTEDADRLIFNLVKEISQSELSPEVCSYIVDKILFIAMDSRKLKNDFQTSLNQCMLPLAIRIIKDKGNAHVFTPMKGITIIQGAIFLLVSCLSLMANIYFICR